MGLIRRMPPALADLVKAEEIAQHPAGIAKELVENALDAGARRVEVEIEEGGVRSLRVSDDGRGMDEEDAGLALLPHATSKLYDVAGLRSIRTMGFRGEALASIARVSHLTLQTRRPEDEVGSRVIGAYGETGAVESCARTPGTTLSVRNLFANVPARLRFLRSPATESRKVLEVVRSAALSRPDVEFLFVADGQRMLHATRTEDTLERIGQVHDPEFAESLMRVFGEYEGVRLDGFVSRPDRAGRRSMKSALFLNDRPFQDRALLAVTRDAMRGRIQQGIFPDAILFFQMDPAKADVNASPDKSVVRFSEMEIVKATVIGAVRRALDDPARVAGFAREGAPEATGDSSSDGNAHSFSIAGSGRGISPLPSFVAEAATQLDLGTVSIPVLAEGGAGGEEALETQGFFAPQQPLRLYQSRNTWIVAEMPDGFLMLDQHAVHERIRYEDLRAGVGAEVQLLAIPEVIDVSRPEMRFLLEESREALGEAGFELDPLGPSSYALRSVPAWSSGRDPSRALRQAMEALAAPGARLMRDRSEVVRERLLQTLACHSAVRAGQALSEEEIRALYSRVRTLDLGFSDVHGRAAAVWIAHEEIMRRMNRGSLPG